MDTGVKNNFNSPNSGNLKVDLMNDAKIEFRHLKNLQISLSNFIEVKESANKLIEKLKQILLQLIGSKSLKHASFSQVNHDTDFIRSNANDILDIIVYMGNLMNFIGRNIPCERLTINDLFQIFYNYCDLVVNFAEKSPIKFDHLTDVLNNLVGSLVELSFYLIKLQETECSVQNKLNIKKLSHEVYRSLGSLIYGNGPKLNFANLQLLFGNANTSGLLSVIRKELENTNMNSNNDAEIEIFYKLDLISTQLIFNLTMPSAISTLNPTDSVLYIDDKYKISIVNFLVKILRFNYNSNISNSNIIKLDDSYTNKINKHFLNKNNQEQADQNRVYASKILTKCLQSLENLFSSIQPDDAKKDKFSTNWIQSGKCEYQLGDILAIVKELSFFGIQRSVNNQNNAKNESKIGHTKLEPNNIDEILLANEEKLSKDENTDKNGDLNNDDDLNRDFNDTKPKKQFKSSNNNYNSSFNNNNNKSNKNESNYKNKRYNPSKNNSKYSSPNQQIDNQTSLTSSNSLNNSINSIKCFNELQVPLIQLKKSNNAEKQSSIESDSDSSSSNHEGSHFYLQKCYARVRVAAIGVLLTVFQVLDKRTIISYWDSFLGSSNSLTAQNLNLVWSIRNDNSPKVRLIAASALSVYLECVKAFFAIAATDESSNSFQLAHQQQSSFLPISYTISNLIRHLHRDLLISLCQIETTFYLNQVQILKCLKNLVKATPYKKLKPGLVFNLIINLCKLLNLKANSILANSNKDGLQMLNEALECLELIFTNHFELVEVHLALLSPINIRQQHAPEEIDSLSNKLEQLSTSIKVPNIVQSRVTYFYDLNSTDNPSTPSLMNCSSTVSGQMTPIRDLFPSDQNDTEETSKSWIISFSLKNSQLDNNNNLGISLSSLSVLQILCRKYFDLFSRDLYFNDISNLILKNIDYAFVFQPGMDVNLVDQIKLKTLRLLEEFSRCIATDELRQMNNIDLNDCCKFWSNLLNTKLISEILCNEQQYLLSSASCDCLAAIGSAIFELLQFQKRVYCLTNLLHLTKSQSTLIRAASVRALGVYVTFASLKEDQNFLCDLSQSLTTLLINDQNNLVRQKTAWSVSNLSEVLVENSHKLGKAFTDEFNLKVWIRLIDSCSIACQREADKIKSYLVRALGNLINYITNIEVEQIKLNLNTDKLSNLEKSLTKSIESVCACRNAKMLKVKWNLSHAIGVAMRNFNSFSLVLNNSNWLICFYDTLLELFSQSSNFKVRINACIALMSINLCDKSLNRIDVLLTNGKLENSIYIRMWMCLIQTYLKIKNENITQIDSTNELQHKTTLLEQLGKLFTYLCKYLRLDDLEYLMQKCFSIYLLRSIQDSGRNEIRGYLVNYIQKIFDQIDKHKQEVQFYNDALTQLHLLDVHKKTSTDENCINLLNGLLQKPNANSSSKNEYESSSENETESQFDQESLTKNRIKFPFKQTYD